MSTVVLPEPIVVSDKEIEKAKSYSILCMNDDWTPMQLVVGAFVAVGLTRDDAFEKMMQIHEKGSAFVLGGLSEDDAKIKREIIIQVTQHGKVFPGIETHLIEEV